jgi:hypothetical protein
MKALKIAPSRIGIEDERSSLAIFELAATIFWLGVPRRLTCFLFSVC